MTAHPAGGGARGEDAPGPSAGGPLALESRLDLRLVPVLGAAWVGAAVLVALPVPAVAATAVTAVCTAAAMVGRVRVRVRGGARRGRPGGAPGGSGVLGAAAASAAVVGAVAVSVLVAAVVQGAGLLPVLTARGATARLEVVVTADPRPVRADPAPGAGAAAGAGAGAGADAGAGAGADAGLGTGVEPATRARPERWVVRVRAEAVGGGGTAGGARAPVLVIGGPAWGDLDRGQRLHGLGRLEATARSDDVRALLLARAPPVAVAPPQGWHRVVADLRAGLQAACAPLPDDAGGLLPGLVVGDTSALPPGLEEAMRATGLTHLTAVSGSNVALVVGAVLALAAALGLRRRARLLLAGAALAAFVGVAGPEPSVLRAGAMGVVGLVGMLSARRGAGVPAVCTAGAVLLVADPWLSRSAGFALSVLATGALLLLARPWAQALARVLPRWLALALAVPVAAQAVCGPVVLLLSDGVPLTAVPANLLAAPAVGPATVLGLVAALLAPWWPGAAQAVAWVGGLATGWVALVARAAARVPGGTLPWPSGVLGAVALAAATVLVVALTGVVADRVSGRRRGPAG